MCLNNDNSKSIIFKRLINNFQTTRFLKNLLAPIIVNTIFCITELQINSTTIMKNLSKLTSYNNRVKIHNKKSKLPHYSLLPSMHSNFLLSML